MQRNLTAVTNNWFNERWHTNSCGTKHKLKKNSTTLWHKHLCHISIQRIQKFALKEIPGPLDLSNFQVCVEYKGKQTKGI